MRTWLPAVRADLPKLANEAITIMVPLATGLFDVCEDLAASSPSVEIGEPPGPVFAPLEQTLQEKFHK